jgi:hypothetical protein
MEAEIIGKEKHEHKWNYYHGVLGYESFVCSVCGKDINDEYHQGEL